MKKFFIYMFLVLLILGSIFTFILYNEGAFKGHVESSKSDMAMKCEAGKCGGGTKWKTK